jgi:hypothetical protein
MQRFNGPFRKAKLALIEHVQLPELIVQFLSRRSKRQHNMIYQFLLVVSVLWLAPVAVDAANSFTYNDDVQCTYPFEQFQVQSITCAKPTYVQLGEGQGNNAKSEALCSFGDQMDLYGRITVSQAVTRDYYITLIACFRSGEASWYNSKHCGTYRVKADLLETITANDNANGAAQQEYITFLAAGTYNWKARLLIPKKTFNFRNGKLAVLLCGRKGTLSARQTSGIQPTVQTCAILILLLMHFFLSQRAL